MIFAEITAGDFINGAVRSVGAGITGCGWNDSCGYLQDALSQPFIYIGGLHIALSWLTVEATTSSVSVETVVVTLDITAPLTMTIEKGDAVEITVVAAAVLTTVDVDVVSVTMHEQTLLTSDEARLFSGAGHGAELLPLLARAKFSSRSMSRSGVGSQVGYGIVVVPLATV